VYPTKDTTFLVALRERKPYVPKREWVNNIGKRGAKIENPENIALCSLYYTVLRGLEGGQSYQAKNEAEPANAVLRTESGDKRPYGGLAW
jgi:hypothetical protein